MRTLGFTILLFAALSASAASKLLILTEPTARALAGHVLEQWVDQIKRVETNFPGGVVVRELDRWDRNWTNQNWTALAAMSNEVVRIQPTHVQIVGSLPMLVSGSHIDDGHEWRCRTSDNWLGCTNITFFDTTNHTEQTGFDAGHLLNRNIPGDGRPDNDEGWFAIPVFRIDFAGVAEPGDDSAWSTGCTAGTNKQAALDEGFCLRAYLTNSLAYRTGLWTNTATGLVTGTLWVGGSGDLDSKAATNFATQLMWTRTSTATAPGTARVYYDNWDNTEVSNLWDGSCNAPKALICFRYRSWQMEFWWSYAAGQRAIGMAWNTPSPAFLIYAWTKHNQGVAGTGPDWVVGPSDRIAFDFVATSINRLGTGKINFGRPILGDGTLPLVPQTGRRGTLSVTNLTITP